MFQLHQKRRPSSCRIGDHANLERSFRDGKQDVPKMEINTIIF